MNKLEQDIEAVLGRVPRVGRRDVVIESHDTGVWFVEATHANNPLEYATLYPHAGYGWTTIRRHARTFETKREANGWFKLNKSLLPQTPDDEAVLKLLMHPGESEQTTTTPRPLAAIGRLLQRVCRKVLPRRMKGIR